MNKRGKAAEAYGTGRSSSLSSGYIRVWRPSHPLTQSDGYIFKHRLVIWEAGIDPTGWEIHHKNGIRTDNRLVNLELKTPTSHHAEHHKPGSIVRNQHGEYIIGTGIQTQYRQLRLEKGTSKCQKCGVSIDHLRLDAQYCGARCQLRAFRARKRAESS